MGGYRWVTIFIVLPGVTVRGSNIIAVYPGGWIFLTFIEMLLLVIQSIILVSVKVMHALNYVS